LFFSCRGMPAFCTVSLHDALPICFVEELSLGAHHPEVVVRDGGPVLVVAALVRFQRPRVARQRVLAVTLNAGRAGVLRAVSGSRSEEHTSELQSRGQLVCRLLLEK